MFLLFSIRSTARFEGLGPPHARASSPMVVETRSHGTSADVQRVRSLSSDVVDVSARPSASTASEGATSLSIDVKTWRAVGAWTWGAGDAGDVCGICRIAYDGCPPDAKFPGDDSPVVWGRCGHAFHLQCITKWLSGNAQDAPRCPICRGAWEFKELEGTGAG